MGYGLDKKINGISPKKIKRLYKHIDKETHTDIHHNQLKCQVLSGREDIRSFKLFKWGED